MMYVFLMLFGILLWIFLLFLNIQCGIGESEDWRVSGLPSRRECITPALDTKCTSKELHIRHLLRRLVSWLKVWFALKGISSEMTPLSGNTTERTESCMHNQYSKNPIWQRNQSCSRRQKFPPPKKKEAKQIVIPSHSNLVEMSLFLTL